MLKYLVLWLIKNKAKAIKKHTSCDYKCKFNITTCNSNQKWNNETYQYECILHTLLIAIILLLILTMICYYYAKSRWRQKDIDVLISI